MEVTWPWVAEETPREEDTVARAGVGLEFESRGAHVCRVWRGVDRVY